MKTSDVVVVLAAAVVLAGLGWFFFGPRRMRSAELTGGVQRVPTKFTNLADLEVGQDRQPVVDPGTVDALDGKQRTLYSPQPSGGPR